jgi:hypothetical protein
LASQKFFDTTTLLQNPGVSGIDSSARGRRTAKDGTPLVKRYRPTTANTSKVDHVAQGADMLAGIDFSDLSDVADSASAYELAYIEDEVYA